jgi:hypothetical protein
MLGIQLIGVIVNIMLCLESLMTKFYSLFKILEKLFKAICIRKSRIKVKMVIRSLKDFGET